MLLLAALCYVTASFSFSRAIASPEAAGTRLAPWLLAAGFAMHTFDLLRAFMVGGAPPVASFAGGFSFFAWLLVGLYLALQSRLPLAAAGALVAPLAFIAVLGDALVGASDAALPQGLRSPWLPVHVTLAFLGNAVFALAFAVSAIYLLQENLLKTHRSGALIRRLPALERLDRLNHVFLLWGFPLLTLGIVTGGIWSMNAWGHFWSWEPREVLAVLTWILYAGLLQLRMLGDLRGRRAAHWTIAAFSFLLVSYLAVNILGIGVRHGLGQVG
ncbi:MAG TPA: cytochrome c biogenesis protein CcsA [Candidatus Limnocylindrales bacterium]|nr:cytochrome c biogenesis protein CcsA [Candidatus Limnocylindrales bacterium]